MSQQLTEKIDVPLSRRDKSRLKRACKPSQIAQATLARTFILEGLSDLEARQKEAKAGA